MSEGGMAPEWWEEACAALGARDALLATLIARSRPPAVAPSGDGERPWRAELKLEAGRETKVEVRAAR